MAVRILTYIGLLYQDLIKTKKIKAGKLPPVFPLVLYNGVRTWNAELRRAFTVWINRVVLKRFEPLTDLPELHDLPEVQEMIEERIDAWKQNLVQQGLYAGILKGKLEGQAQLLLHFLMWRFGVLPPAVVAQINAASNLEQIEAWFDAAIDAPNLNAMFLLH